MVTKRLKYLSMVVVLSLSFLKGQFTDLSKKTKVEKKDEV